jgi:hypothetical protein
MMPPMEIFAFLYKPITACIRKPPIYIGYIAGGMGYAMGYKCLTVLIVFAAACIMI